MQVLAEALCNLSRNAVPDRLETVEFKKPIQYLRYGDERGVIQTSSSHRLDTDRDDRADLPQLFRQSFAYSTVYGAVSFGHPTRLTEARQTG